MNVRDIMRLALLAIVCCLAPRVDAAEPARIHTAEKPLDLTINPPAPMRPQELPAGRTLADEIELRVGKRAPAGVRRAEGDWLAKAGVGDGEMFSVEGWFEVPEDDVYQFQLRGNVTIQSLLVDGVPQNWPRGNAWWFVPVNLAKGLHRVNVKGTGVAGAALDIRFGGPGAYKLDGSRFKRLVK